MQTKKHLSLKLKTLSLTLALIAGISAQTSLAYNAGDEGKKAQDFGDSMELFLSHYDSDKEYKNLDISTTASSTGTGAFSGKEVTASNNSFKITGAKDLTKTILENLIANAAILDKTAGDVTKVFGDPIVPVEGTHGVYPIKRLLTDFDPDNDNATDLAKDIITQAKNKIIASTTTYNGYADSKNLSDFVTTKDHLDGIDDINHIIHVFHKIIVKKPAANDGGAGLDSSGKRKAFFNYIAAYLDNKDNYLTAETKDAIFGTLTNAKLSELANNIVALFDNTGGGSIAQHFLNDNVKFNLITNDQQLKEASEMSDDQLNEKVTKLKFAGSDQNKLVNFFATAKAEADTDKKTTLVNQLMEKLTPNARAAGGAVRSASKTAMQNIISHQQVIAEGVNSGDDDYIDGNTWFRAGYSNLNVDKQGNSPAYKQKSIGFGIGVDQALNEKLTMGLSYNYVNSDVKGKYDYLKEDVVKSHAFGSYLSMMYDNIFADVQVNYIKNKTDGFHKTSANSSRITYKYEGEAVNAILGLAMHVDLGRNWYTKPKICFAFANYKTDTYDEQDSVLAPTQIDIARYQSAELGLQLAIGANLIIENYKLSPKLNLGFMYDLNDKKDKAIFSFMGRDNIVSEGPKRDRANLNVAVGTGLSMDNISISLDYDFNYSRNTKAHGVSAKVSCML